MTKRAAGNFARSARDFYRTPYEAVVPLLPHLGWSCISTFIEPCAGDGVLTSHLEANGLKCIFQSDIVPNLHVRKKNALSWCPQDIYGSPRFGKPERSADAFITNPPWSREILHPMIEVLAGLLPTWLLFDSDWAYNIQAIPYLEYCQRIVAVGRVCWFPETKMSGFDNASWYLFDRVNKSKPYTEFYGRQTK